MGDLEFELKVSEAKILFDLEAKLDVDGCDGLKIASPKEFLDFISPSKTGINFAAGLDVSLPVFAIVGGFGFGEERADIHEL